MKTLPGKILKLLPPILKRGLKVNLEEKQVKEEYLNLFLKWYGRYT